MEEIRESHKPISPWGYVGYEFLFAIPIVGLVLAIVFSITSKNKNLKNFAKAQLIMIVIGIVLFFVLTALGLMKGMTPEQIEQLLQKQ